MQQTWWSASHGPMSMSTGGIDSIFYLHSLSGKPQNLISLSLGHPLASHGPVCTLLLQAEQVICMEVKRSLYRRTGCWDNREVRYFLAGYGYLTSVSLQTAVTVTPHGAPMEDRNICSQASAPVSRQVWFLVSVSMIQPCAWALVCELSLWAALSTQSLPLES